MRKATLEVSKRQDLNTVWKGQSSRALFDAQRLIAVFASLTGLLGIALVAARVLPEQTQNALTTRPVLLTLAAAALVVSAVWVSPPGRLLTRGWAIPYVGAEQNLAKFVFLAVELGVLVLVFRLFDLENTAFYENIATLAFAGFLVQHYLPMPYRMPFFVFLSLIGFASVLGVLNTAWILALGLALIGLTRAPLAFNVRVGLVLVAAVLLALVRVNVIPSPWPVVIFPIVGSIFMFRMMIYLYDLKHSKTKPGLTHTLAYFFLLPNVIFPLFPTVDFTAFRRSFFDGDPYDIYQRGIRWMFRGTVYLLLYRFLYYYVVIAPTDIANAGDLARYLTSNYMLILRIIGQYDIIVGLLHLFGFNLSEANLLNFFASSFTDFWRRANIYWKDFMLKVFYYPAYFQLRRFGPTAGLVLATVVVFFMTWVLHGYQWFWILGSYPITLQDSLFWGFFGLLMVVNLLWESKFGRKRTLKGAPQSWQSLAGKGLRIAAMFAFICVLWSLWTSASLAEWFSLWEAATVMPVLDPQAILLTVVGTAVFLAIYAGVAIDWNFGKSDAAFFKGAAITAALIVLVYLGNSPFTYTRLGAQAQGFITDLEQDRLNQPDANNLTRGYYENILSVNGANSQLWQVYMQKEPKDVWIQQTSATRFTGDFLTFALKPNVAIMFRQKPFHTNRYAMRDRDYEMTKPANTFRIALLGPSYVMGSGVGDNETFENVLEDRLNSEDAGKPYAHYEILNFAVASYTNEQHVWVLENQALQFQPDAVFLVQTSIDPEILVRDVARNLYNGINIPFPEVKQIAARAGAEQAPSEEEAERRLMPYKFDLVAWSYNRIVQDLRSRGIVPLWIYLPALGHAKDPQRIADLMRLARQAGFTTIDLSDVYHNQDVPSLQVASWDTHPNARGHQLIADHLYSVLHEQDIRAVLGLDNGRNAQAEPTSPKANQ